MPLFFATSNHQDDEKNEMSSAHNHYNKEKHKKEEKFQSWISQMIENTFRRRYFDSQEHWMRAHLSYG